MRKKRNDNERGGKKKVKGEIQLREMSFNHQTQTPCGFLLVGTGFSSCRGDPSIRRLWPVLLWPVIKFPPKKKKEKERKMKTSSQITVIILVINGHARVCAIKKKS